MSLQVTVVSHDSRLTGATDGAIWGFGYVLVSPVSGKAVFVYDSLSDAEDLDLDIAPTRVAVRGDVGWICGPSGLVKFGGSHGAPTILARVDDEFRGWVLPVASAQVTGRRIDHRARHLQRTENTDLRIVDVGDIAGILVAKATGISLMTEDLVELAFLDGTADDAAFDPLTSTVFLFGPNADLRVVRITPVGTFEVLTVTKMPDVQGLVRARVVGTELTVLCERRKRVISYDITDPEAMVLVLDAPLADSSLYWERDPLRCIGSDGAAIERFGSLDWLNADLPVTVADYTSVVAPRFALHGEIAALTYRPAAPPMVITVDTTKTGTGSTASTHFKLPLKVAGTYDFTVDWGDGTNSPITAWNDPAVDHTYGAPGVYTVKVSGLCSVWSFNNAGDKLKVLSVVKWGDAVTTTLDFYGCSNMTSVAGSATDYPRVTNFTNTFRGCSGLTSFPLINTSNVTFLDASWRGCSGLTGFPLIDTSQVTNFSNTWFGCSGLTSFPLLDTSEATGVSYAWYGCVGLSSFPLIDTSKVLSFNGAWAACSGLTAFPLLPYTSTVTDFTSAWQGCSGLTSFPLLDTSKGVSFSFTWSGCAGLTSLPLVDTSKGTTFAFAWQSCTGLTSFPLLNTGKGTNFNSAWSGCTGLAWYNFPTLDMHLMTVGTLCFGFTGGGSGWAMSLSAYDAILNQLANGDGGGIPANTTSNTVFSGGNSKYTAAAVAGRATLTATRSWTVTDGGLK